MRLSSLVLSSLVAQLKYYGVNAGRITSIKQSEKILPTSCHPALIPAPGLPDEDIWKRKFTFLGTGYVYAPYIPVFITPPPKYSSIDLSRRYGKGLKIHNEWYVNANFTS